jgi:hypothetical protein
MTPDEKREYDDGYADGYNRSPRDTDSMESWYTAGFENGQSDRLMGKPDQLLKAYSARKRGEE